MASAEYQRQWRAKNKEKAAKYMRTWRAKHPEVALANSRKWISANREKTREAAREWYRRNREAINQKRRKERKANPEKYRSRKRKRTYKPDARKKTYEKYREQNIRKSREYHAKNPQVRKTINSRRRAAILSGGSHTTAAWLEKVHLLGMFCTYCKTDLTHKTLTKDHVIPLSKGGTDNIENIVPSCLRCNQVKSDKLPSVDGTSRKCQILNVTSA